jgi:hypothetical protein
MALAIEDCILLLFWHRGFGESRVLAILDLRGSVIRRLAWTDKEDRTKSLDWIFGPRRYIVL